MIEYLGTTNDVRPFCMKVLSIHTSFVSRRHAKEHFGSFSSWATVITTNVPGCRDTVVDEYNGFLVPVKDQNP